MINQLSNRFSIAEVLRCIPTLLLLLICQISALAARPSREYHAALQSDILKIAPVKKKVQSREATQSDSGIGIKYMCNYIDEDTYNKYGGTYMTDCYAWFWSSPADIIYEDTQTTISYNTSDGNPYFYFRIYNGGYPLEAVKIYLDKSRTNNAEISCLYADWESNYLYYNGTEVTPDYENGVIYWKPNSAYEHNDAFFYLESGELNVIGFEVYSQGKTPDDFMSTGIPEETVTPPVFRPAPCTFTDPMTVEIHAEPGTDIYYSTNGYGPSVKEQYKYNDPIVISSTAAFKAIAVDANGNSSRISTAKYTCTRKGIGEGYDPESPGNPGKDPSEKTYHLTVVANPSGVGFVRANSYDLKAGDNTNVSASNNNGFVFLNWTIEGEEVSKSASFNYVMPEYDVTIVANYVYDPQSPGNPSPEEQKVKHPVVVRSIPSGAASLRPSGVFDMEENSSQMVYAYPVDGWELVGWTINGEQQQETTSPLTVSMGEKALDIVAYFNYNPSSPSNPAANYYNPTTGQVIVDDFVPGKLYNAINGLVGNNNFSKINDLIIKGKISSNDIGVLSYFSNAVNIDLSRTSGVASIPAYTFQSMAASNIVLPSTINSIGNYAFSDCGDLISLTIYAQTPPSCSSNTFSNFTNKGNCTVFVPKESVELYSNAEYWKDFTILPITNDAHVLQVNLPADASDGRYKHNSLEIVNVNSGVRQKYVISDRVLYTFNGLQKDEQYNIYMFSQAGLEIGRIENVVIPDEDIEVTFDNLKPLKSVFAKVLSPDGSDVTSQVSVEWLKPLADGTTTYLRKAVSLGEIPDGQQLICRITLDNRLGVIYTNPNDVEFTVSDGNNTCAISLAPFRSIELTGTVVDNDGAVLSGASVSINQTLNGKYSKSFTAKTDRKGLWNASVLDAPETRLTFAASECINVNDTIGAFEPNISAIDLGKTTLKSIIGARITYGFTYHAAGSEEVQDYYSDYQNVAVSVFNITQNRAHNEVSLQYPVIAVLDENINAGDKLRLTATSKTGAFSPIVQTVIIGEDQRAEATFDIVGKGGISASFEMTDNPAVIALLYSDKGEFLKKITYFEAKATFTELEDGDYTLVSMGQSDLMNSILRLSSFSEIGLTEGKEYVKNNVKVESGKLSEVTIPEVPAFDESLFYYTNSSTSFSANKSSITTGNYLTLRSAIDFKGVYKDGISNVALIVDLPEACDFVEQSVIQGPNLLPYTFDNKRLTIQLGDKYLSQVRLCVIPTAGGPFNATASIVFIYNGKTITQPIGSATSDIKDIEITVPSVIAKNTFKVSGSALGNSNVNIYEDGVLLGSGKANAAGLWNVECELSNPYNLSTHPIHAEITTPAGNTLTSETKALTYDVNAIRVSKVTMYHWNPEINVFKGQMEISVFDFLNPKASATQWTVYYPQKQFTYTIEFTDNDPERISNVILYVHTADGKFVPVSASFDKNKGLWYAEIDMGNTSNGYYPVNCSVDFSYTSTYEADHNQIYATLDNISILKDKCAASKRLIDEAENASQQIEEDLIAADPILTQFVEAICNSNGSSTSLVEQYLSAVSGNDITIDVSVPDVITDEYVDGLLSDIDSILNNTDILDATDFTSVSEEIESNLSLLTDDNKKLINSLIQDEYVLESDEGNNMTIKTITVDEWNLISSEFEDPIEYDLTNGSTIALYQNGNSIYAVDNDRDIVYVIAQQNNSASLHAPAKALSSADFVSNMKDAANAVKDLVAKLHTFLSPLIDAANSELDKIRGQLSTSKAALEANTFLLHRTENELREVESALARLDNRGVDATIDERMDYHEKSKLKEDLLKKKSEYARKVKDFDRTAKRLDKSIKSLDAKLIAGLAVLGNIREAWEFCNKLYRICDYTVSAQQDFSKWNSFIDSILPCDDDADNAEALRQSCIADRDEILWRTGYVPAVTITAITTAVQGYLMTNKAAKVITQMVVGLIMDFVDDFAKQTFEKTQSISANRYNANMKLKSQLKCKKKCGQPGMPPCEDPDPDDDKPNRGNKPGGGANQSGAPNDGVQIDPSGFVYEAVPSNRVEGVQASIYYKETKEDMYGDPYEEVVLWNAEEYAQKNPLFTDENGMYRWDVPQGLWQVKFEKDGYQTAYSKWLPVPPPQLDVNIAITQNKQPEITEARAYEEGIEVQFDKFMNPATLTTDNIFVTANGEKLNGEIRLIDSALADEYATEDDTDAARYASRIRFVPDEKLSATTGEIRLTVSRNVLSYAGIPMTETFSQALDVEKEVQIVYADDTKVLYGGEKEVTVYALPYEAAVGRTLHIANSSDLIASTDVTEATLDEEGKAVIKVKGNLPGHAQLTFTIDDVTVSGECAVDVVTEIITAEAPKSSRASGTAVYRGTKVELTTESKNATIYFTTDGSCPCDENGTRRKYTVPIIINDDTQILAMTSVGDGDDDVSETVEFNYTLKRSDMDLHMEQGWTWISHNLESPIKPEVLSSDNKVSRIQSRSHETLHDPQKGWQGTLTELSAAESYKVNANVSTVSQHINGVEWNPATPISINAGWNWLGYPVSQTMSVDEAFATTAAETLDVVVGQNGFAQFDGSKWIGTLETMSPGLGYMYFSQSSKNVVYNTSIVSTASAKYTSGISDNSPLVLDIHKYSMIMPVVATIVDKDGSPLNNEEYQVTAFCGTECRGIGKVVNGLVMMNVFGNENDNITFQLADIDQQHFYKNNASMNFRETVVGDISNPYKIIKDGAITAINDVKYDGNISVSVENDMLRIKGIAADDIDFVEVYDIDGRKLIHETNISESGIRISILTTGVYVVVVNGNGEYSYHKISVH